MRTPWTAIASLLLIAFLTASCQKIGSEPLPRGPLPIEKMAFDNAISLQYGELVTVTAQPEGSVYVLWFVKPDKTIVAVAVNSTRGTLAGHTLTIPRR